MISSHKPSQVQKMMLDDEAGPYKAREADEDDDEDADGSKEADETGGRRRRGESSDQRG